MTTAARELITSRSFTCEQPGLGAVKDSPVRSATRTWLTDATSRADAVIAVTSLSANGLTSTHPEDSTLLLDGFSFSSNGDGTYLVTANYSRQGLLVLEQVTKKNIGATKYVRWNWGTYDYTIDFPYAVRVNSRVPNAVPPVDVKRWVGGRLTVPKTDTILEIELRISKVSYDDVQKVAKQTNTLHNFKLDTSRQWLFTGATIRNVNDLEDLITYQWRGDLGDLKYEPGNPANSTATTKYYDAVLDSAQTATLLYPSVARGQHEAWNLTPDPSGDASQPPKFQSIAKYGIGDYTLLPYLKAAITNL